MSRSSTRSTASNGATRPDYTWVFEEWFAASFGEHLLSLAFRPGKIGVRHRAFIYTQNDPVSKALVHAGLAVRDAWSQDCKVLAGGSNYDDADRARTIAAELIQEYTHEAQIFVRACERQPPIGTGRPVHTTQTPTEDDLATNEDSITLTSAAVQVPGVVVTSPTGVSYVPPTSLIALSASGLRVDLELPPWPPLNGDEFKQLRSRLCFEHNLRRGGCSRGARCKYNHEAVGRHVKAALATHARKVPCKQGRNCRNGDCLWGHTCRWETCKRSTLTKKGKACILPEEMHWDREIVQCVHASPSETDDRTA